MLARWAVVLLAGVVFLLTPARGSAAALQWSSPVVIDGARSSPLPTQGDLVGVSCPSASLCVAVDDNNNVFVSSNPVTGSWQLTATLPGIEAEMAAIACPSTQLCVLTTDDGRVITSTNPGVGGTWKTTQLDPNYELVAISCPSVSECFAVTRSGRVLSTVNPTGGPRAWHAQRVAGDQLVGISCPTVRLCVALDTKGELSSTRPTRGGSAWRRVGLNRDMSGVSCPSTRLCLIVTWGGWILSSTRPTGGTGAWRAAPAATAGGHTYSAPKISCASVRLCVAVNDGGNVFSSTRPTGGARAWRRARIGFYMYAVTCTSSALCVIADHQHVRTSISPAGGAATWRGVSLYAPVVTPPSLTGVSCATVELCVAADNGGGVVSSSNPTGGPSAWNRQKADTAALNGVSCASGPLCVAVDSAGGVLVSSNPTGAAPVWSRAVVDAGHQLTAVACPSVQLCVATDDAGNVVSSTNPTAGAGAWSKAQLRQAAGLTAIACPSTTLCIAGDGAGHVFSSSDPSGGPSAWKVVATDHGTPDTPSRSIAGVSCASANLCVAVDHGSSNAGAQSGGVLSSTAPTTTAWKFADVEPYMPPPERYYPPTLQWFNAVSCPSNQLCAAIAISNSGSPYDTSSAAVSQNPTDGGSWSNTDIDDSEDVNAISCPSTQLCIAVDDIGQAIVGTGS